MSAAEVYICIIWKCDRGYSGGRIDDNLMALRRLHVLEGTGIQKKKGILGYTETVFR